MAGPQIRDRAFGAPVDKKTRTFFKNLEKGAFEVPPNEEISDSQHHRDYLGDSIPFVRMWSAILISGSHGSEIKYFVVNDNNQKLVTEFNEYFKKNIAEGDLENDYDMRGRKFN